jgi:hypothetical protein
VKKLTYLLRYVMAAPFAKPARPEALTTAQHLTVVPPVGARVRLNDHVIAYRGVIVDKRTRGRVIDLPMADDAHVAVEWPVLGGLVIVHDLEVLAPRYTLGSKSILTA